MNCLCNIFDNEVIWLVIIALLLCNTCGGGCATPAYGRSDCGCGCGCNR